MIPDLVIIGPLLIDDMLPNGASHPVILPGGSVLYAALAASLLPIKVGLASICGQDYPTSAIELLHRKGIDLSGLMQPWPQGCRCVIRFDNQGTRHFSYPIEYPSIEDNSPTYEQIPASLLKCTNFLITPFHYEKQITLLQMLRQNHPQSLIAIDPYDDIPNHAIPKYLNALQLADFCIPSQAEYESFMLEADENNQFSPRQALIIKMGERGCRYRLRKEAAFQKLPAIPCKTFINPNGAGDTFCGALLSFLTLQPNLPKALKHAMATASFTVEAEGHERLVALEIGEVVGRVE